jgi:hypothetical protein
MATEPQQGALETSKSFLSILIEALEYRRSKGELSAEIEEVFRRAIRRERLEQAKRKLHSLALDQNNVLSAQYGGQGVLDVDEGLELISHELTVDEFTRLHNTRARLGTDIIRLLDALVDGPDDNIDALWRVIEAAGLLGRFMGPHPLQEKLKTKPAKDRRAQKNEHWVQPFNKAIRQAHSDGLTGKAAIDAACEKMKRDGVKMPVGDEALRSRERELRTGKKRK